MSHPLPTPIATYFAAANRHDGAAAVACFDRDATVRDEGHTLVGAVAIRAWLDDTTRRYAPRLSIEGSERNGNHTLVMARVSDTFPGSPARLQYRFVSEALITRLEIGL